MPEQDKTNSDEPVKTNEDKKDSQRGLWIIIGVGVVVLLAVVTVGSFFVYSQRIRFITEFSLTVALATLVGVQAYIYKRQWEAMERQSRETERQSKLTEQTIKSNRRHTIYTLRAYVNIRVVVPAYPDEILLGIENFGQTPAHKVQFASAIRVKPSLEVPEAIIETLRWYDEGVTMPPGLQVEKRLRIGKLSDEDVRLLNSGDGSHKLFVWGAIRYRDIFRRNRYTRFCIAYRVDTKTLESCPDGNDAT